MLPHIDIAMHTRSMPATDVFYWASILVASTYGTTMGDFVADQLGLGFGPGSLLLFSLLLVVLFFEFRAKASNKFRYWTAFVITSTIGATTGDFLSKPDALNLGYVWSMLILVAIFAVIFAIKRSRQPVHLLTVYENDAILPHIDLS